MHPSIHPSIHPQPTTPLVLVTGSTLNHCVKATLTHPSRLCYVSFMFVSSGVRNTEKYFNPVYKALCLCPQSDWLEGILLSALRDYDASSQSVACLECYTHCQVGTSSRCHLVHTFSASYVRKERDPAEGLEQRHLCPLPHGTSATAAAVYRCV